MNPALRHRIARTAIRSCFQRVASKVTMGDPLEIATGLERKMLLAQEAGNNDPFELFTKIGTGTKDDPIQVKSIFESRLVGCFCNEEALTAYYMLVHKDENKRCECGRWFTLIPTQPF